MTLSRTFGLSGLACILLSVSVTTVSAEDYALREAAMERRPTASFSSGWTRALFDPVAAQANHDRSKGAGQRLTRQK